MGCYFDAGCGTDAARHNGRGSRVECRRAAPSAAEGSGGVGGGLGSAGAGGDVLGALLVGARVGTTSGGEPAAHATLREGKCAALDDVP